MSRQRSLAALALLLWFALCGLAYWLADARADECRGLFFEWQLTASVRRAVFDCMAGATWTRDATLIAAGAGLLVAVLGWARQSASPPAQ